MNRGKELYRSFEGLLDVDNQYGYIIYDYSKNYFLIEDISVWTSSHIYLLINKENKFDFSDLEKIGSLGQDVEHGCIDGAVMIDGKWYYQKEINDIQKKYGDYHWRSHI